MVVRFDKQKIKDLMSFYEEINFDKHLMKDITQSTKYFYIFFFYGGRILNFIPYIYYALSIPIDCDFRIKYN